jgi:hypothetical protein
VVRIVPAVKAGARFDLIKRAARSQASRLGVSKEQ